MSMNRSDYWAENGIHARTMYRDLQRGLIIKTGPDEIFQNQIVHARPRGERLRQLIAMHKQYLDELILTADPQNKQATVLIIENYVRTQRRSGIIIKGYNRKSIYRKINKARAEGRLQRKTRRDKGLIRHQTLSTNFDKIQQLAVQTYMQHAQGSLSLIVDLIIHFAREHEEYYEIAGISRSTLYRQLRAAFIRNGFRNMHQFVNHYNKWKATLPTVTGAFTDDIQFMQYISGDDHKCDVAGVLYFNEHTGKVEQKQIKIWFWNEAKTMYPLGWVIKVGDFTAEDLIRSLSQVVYQYGLPLDNVLIDNGIGRSDEFRQFWIRLAQKEPHFSAAYTPTNKATIELGFGIFKREFDSFQTNFVSPHKEDGRHPTAALSAPAADLLAKEYIRKLESYLTGFFIERDRVRVINGKPTRINIKKQFEQHMLTYQPRAVSARDIRFALSQSVIKRYENGITLNRDTYLPSDALPFSFTGREFIVFYNPHDRAEVDLYASDQMIVGETGEIIDKGGYVTTLYNTRTHPEKRALVMKLRAQANKLARQAVEKHVIAQQIEHPTPDTVSTNGQLLEQRAEHIKRLQTKVRDVIDTLPDEAIPSSSQSAATEAEYGLTYEQEEESNDPT